MVFWAAGIYVKGLALERREHNLPSEKERLHLDKQFVPDTKTFASALSLCCNQTHTHTHTYLCEQASSAAHIQDPEASEGFPRATGPVHVQQVVPGQVDEKFSFQILRVRHQKAPKKQTAEILHIKNE